MREAHQSANEMDTVLDLTSNRPGRAGRIIGEQKKEKSFISVLCVCLCVLKRFNVVMAGNGGSD